jgi:hypothetical protein
VLQAAAAPPCARACAPLSCLRRATPQVSQALASWESRGLAQRSALEGLVACRYARAWEAALRTLAAAATGGAAGGHAQGPGGGGGRAAEAAEAGAGGGSGSGGSGLPSPAAYEFLQCPPERLLLSRLMFAGSAGARRRSCSGGGGGGSSGAAAEADASWAAAVNQGGAQLAPVARALAAKLESYASAAAASSCDVHAKAAAAAFVRRLQRAVEKRHRAVARDAAGHEVGARGSCLDVGFPEASPVMSHHSLQRLGGARAGEEGGLGLKGAPSPVQRLGSGFIKAWLAAPPCLNLQAGVWGCWRPFLAPAA